MSCPKYIDSHSNWRWFSNLFSLDLFLILITALLLYRTNAMIKIWSVEIRHATDKIKIWNKSRKQKSVRSGTVCKKVDTLILKQQTSNISHVNRSPSAQRSRKRLPKRNKDRCKMKAGTSTGDSGLQNSTVDMQGLLKRCHKDAHKAHGHENEMLNTTQVKEIKISKIETMLETTVSRKFSASAMPSESGEMDSTEIEIDLQSVSTGTKAEDKVDNLQDKDQNAFECTSSYMNHVSEPVIRTHEKEGNLKEDICDDGKEEYSLVKNEQDQECESQTHPKCLDTTIQSSSFSISLASVDTLCDNDGETSVQHGTNHTLGLDLPDESAIMQMIDEANSLATCALANAELERQGQNFESVKAKEGVTNNTEKVEKSQEMAIETESYARYCSKNLSGTTLEINIRDNQSNDKLKFGKKCVKENELQEDVFRSDSMDSELERYGETKVDRNYVNDGQPDAETYSKNSNQMTNLIMSKGHEFGEMKESSDTKSWVMVPRGNGYNTGLVYTGENNDIIAVCRDECESLSGECVLQHAGKESIPHCPMQDVMSRSHETRQKYATSVNDIEEDGCSDISYGAEGNHTSEQVVISGDTAETFVKVAVRSNLENQQGCAMFSLENQRSISSCKHHGNGDTAVASYMEYLGSKSVENNDTSILHAQRNILDRSMLLDEGQLSDDSGQDMDRFHQAEEPQFSVDCFDGDNHAFQINFDDDAIGNDDQFVCRMGENIFYTGCEISATGYGTLQIEGDRTPGTDSKCNQLENDCDEQNDKGSAESYLDKDRMEDRFGINLRIDNQYHLSPDGMAISFLFTCFIPKDIPIFCTHSLSG